MRRIEKTALLIIEDRELLVARSRGKDFFIPPGGKPEGKETLERAGVREGREELGIEIQEDDLELVGKFDAPAAGQTDTVVSMSAYLVKRYTGEPSPQREVEELDRVNSSNDRDLNLGSILEHDILPLLKNQNLID